MEAAFYSDAPNTCFLVFKLLNISFLQLVAGSVVMAFLTVCPERIDLIHKNYRKLCNLLVDVDEWGQVMILNLLTRYARTQFIDPNNEVRSVYSVVLPIRCQYLLDVMYSVTDVQLTIGNNILTVHGDFLVRNGCMFDL